jgi:hypothetical protein
VSGAVYAPDGVTKVPHQVVAVACGASGPAEQVSADSLGYYNSNLTASDSLMTATQGKIPCEFVASQPSGAKRDTTTTVRFKAVGELQGLVLINLYLH